MRSDGGQVGPSAPVLDVRTCGVLRLVEEQARDQALSQCSSSADSLDRAWGIMDVVLCGPDGAGGDRGVGSRAGVLLSGQLCATKPRGPLSKDHCLFSCIPEG